MVREPTGIDERPDQLRPPVVKGEGVTETERYLARLAEKSLLNLWSFPTPFRDQGGSNEGDGKELCDLLVVCGRNIIIFSEKNVAWPKGALTVAWCRWTRSAIRDAAKQAKGAERWIAEFSDRIFLDRKCTEPFPIDFPPEDDRIVHRVVVVRGASDACRREYPDGSGSLVIKPSIIGSDHWSGAPNEIEPFAVGDIDPHGSFVHVLDEVSLDIVMKELDTVTDFTSYLEKKAEFVRSGNLAAAHGEENLLSYYAIRVNDEGEHDFTLEDETKPLTIPSGNYDKLTSNPRYMAKEEANKISYLWDGLIEAFTSHMLDGTSITLEGHEFDLRKNEMGVRYMALQSRFERRSFGDAVRGALEKGQNAGRFFRGLASPDGVMNDGTGFFILTLKYLDWMEEKGGYEQYRIARSASALIYANGVLEKFPQLKRIVGVAMEPPSQGRGGSEDLIYVEQADWTEADREAIRRDCRENGVLQDPQEVRLSHQEYPDVTEVVVERPAAEPGLRPNRKERRRQAAAARRRKR